MNALLMVGLLGVVIVSAVFAKAMYEGVKTAAALEAEDQKIIEAAEEADEEIPYDELNLDPETGLRKS